MDRLANGSAGDDVTPTPYLELLDRALEDRYLSAIEANGLAEFAAAYGMSRGDVVAAHTQYFDALTAAAWEDGILSRTESEDLRRVAEFLGIDPTRVEAALRRPARESSSARVGPTIEGLAGKTVCFTGTLVSTMKGQLITREQAQDMAARAGMDVRDSVTKTLDVLVVADPLSISGKAQKARQYGTRIIAEAVFWEALGVRTD
jgi:DNA polymerase-3 subunit epsilon